ncbi:uncharacterized protein LOC128311011 [Acinonyx jubatus]|uniref:Uncharacterized protein LOC128311011 n=1 Tax=Acinonyx jubatus TaxID=32536 RepID=A0ABM3N821_ACIJB|nr:uncharacterized protein LOC128311011 [Acinonyx jubatus]
MAGEMKTAGGAEPRPHTRVAHAHLAPGLPALPELLSLPRTWEVLSGAWGDVGPCPQGREHGFYGPAVEAWGKVGLTSPPAAARLLRTRCGGFGRTWGHVHRDKNLVSSGSAVEDLKGRGAADTGTGTQFPQAPLWRLGGTWAHVHRDRNPVSSGPAVETSRGRGIASTGTRTRSPQDPPQEEQIQACFREETLTEIQKHGSCIQLGRGYMKCSSQDLLEE